LSDPTKAEVGYDWCGACVQDECLMSKPTKETGANPVTGEEEERCWCYRERKESRKPSDENSQLSFLDLF